MSFVGLQGGPVMSMLSAAYGFLKMSSICQHRFSSISANYNLSFLCNL